MATAHIESKLEDIAPIVIMPGDPLRAKFIAEHFLEDAKQVNSVRNIFGYTGFYHGKKVTIFSSGMGNPSMAIYAYELYQFYHVETIIRIGSIGAYQEQLNLFDLILAEKSFSTSNFAMQYAEEDVSLVEADQELTDKIEKTALRFHQKIYRGTIHCSDAFYQEGKLQSDISKKCLGVEMETFALFYLAKKLHKKAAAILTVSNSFVKEEETTSEQREKHFVDMIKLSLETI